MPKRARSQLSKSSSYARAAKIRRMEKSQPERSQLKFFASYLCDRKQFVRLGCFDSPSYHARSGEESNTNIAVKTELFDFQSSAAVASTTSENDPLATYSHDAMTGHMKKMITNTKRALFGGGVPTSEDSEDLDSSGSELEIADSESDELEEILEYESGDEHVKVESPLGWGVSSSRFGSTKIDGSYDNGISGRRRDRAGRVLEVCINDDEIPLSLKNMVECERDRCGKQELQDVKYSVVQKLFGGDSKAIQFEWSPMATFSGRPEEFLQKKPGPTTKVSDAYRAFRMFWNDDILDHIAMETNRHATELMSLNERFAKDWYPTNRHEILILFAFWIMTGVIQMPSIKSCFSNNHILKTNIFKTLMSEDRYWYLNRALNFVDESTTSLLDSLKLFSISPIVKHLNSKFQQAYILDQNITIEESLALRKGHLPYKQTIETKRGQFGIKAYELRESATGYLWSFVITTGKDNPKTTDIVVQLMRPLLNKGHKLFLGSSFNSPILARFLKRNKTDCVGILLKSCPNVPALIQLASLEQGTCIARHSEDVVVMAYQDKMPLYTISTCHSTESVLVAKKPGRPAHYRPAVLADSNVAMRKIDKKYQMLEPVVMECKKNNKWYVQIFMRLLNVSILNSRIIIAKSSVKPVGHQTFRLKLVHEIIHQNLHYVPNLNRDREMLRTDLPFERLIGNNHFIIRNYVDGRKTSRKSRCSAGRMPCIWCTIREKRRRTTVYKCETCNVGLCLESCFKKFHTIA